MTRGSKGVSERQEQRKNLLMTATQLTPFEKGVLETLSEEGSVMAVSNNHFDGDAGKAAQCLDDLQKRTQTSTRIQLAVWFVKSQNARI